MNDKEKTRIKEYIEANCEKDKVAEAGEYEDRLENYIMKQAREYLNSQNGMVEDSTVFNWVFDFFHDEEYKKAEEIKKKLDTEVKEKIARIPSHLELPKPEKKKKESSFESFSLFDL